MSAPGDALTQAMLRHQASIEASRAVAERIALENERQREGSALPFTVPNGSADSTTTER